MSKSSKSVPKICCERYKRHLRAFSKAEKNIIIKPAKTCTNSEISWSMGVLNKSKENRITTPKKTAKSDLTFNQNLTNIDYCKKCGDVVSKCDNRISRPKVTSQVDLPNVSNKINYKNQLQQFYRNENFNQSAHSIYTTENTRKISLTTILEQPEKLDPDNNIFKIYPDSDEDIGFMDPDNCDNFKNIKEFRNKNYFECHSAKSRINSKSNVTSLNHKCVYRFYLNDRLFLVPFNTDYQGNIRCMECFLPLNKNVNNTKFNGTVQAKVKINNEVQDMLLVLPVNDSLIVKEKRKEVKEDDSIYFGIVKLDMHGNSVFNRTLPEDSLALRYQKGYKEFSRMNKYEYESIEKDDIIYI